MTEITIKDGEDNESTEELNLDETNEELVEGNEQEQTEEVEQEEQADYTDVLRQAKIEALINHYLPEGTDVDKELHFVELKVDENGNVSGSGEYRPLAVKTTSNKTKTSKPKQRAVPAPPIKEWAERRAEIQAAKLAAGIIN